MTETKLPGTDEPRDRRGGMTELTSKEGARNFSALVSRAAFGGERIVLTRHGRPVAAVVPVADLEKLARADVHPGATRKPPR